MNDRTVASGRNESTELHSVSINSSSALSYIFDRSLSVFGNIAPWLQEEMKLSPHQEAAMLIEYAREGQELTSFKLSSRHRLCYRLRKKYQLLYRIAAWTMLIVHIFEYPAWTYNVDNSDWSNGSIYPSFGLPYMPPIASFLLQILCISILWCAVGMEFGYKHNTKNWICTQIFAGILFLETISIAVNMAYSSLSQRPPFSMMPLFTFVVIIIEPKFEPYFQYIGRTIPKFCVLFLLVAEMIFAYTCMGFLIFSPTSEEREKYFPNFGTAIWNMLMVANASDWPSPMIPAFHHNRLYCLFFYIYIVMIDWGLLNLLLGFVYLFIRIEQDRISQHMREYTQEYLSRAFSLLDCEEKGAISYQSTAFLLKDIYGYYLDVLIAPTIDELHELILQLDTQGKGEVTREMFLTLPNSCYSAALQVLRAKKQRFYRYLSYYFAKHPWSPFSSEEGQQGAAAPGPADHINLLMTANNNGVAMSAMNADNSSHTIASLLSAMYESHPTLAANKSEITMRLESNRMSVDQWKHFQQAVHEASHYSRLTHQHNLLHHLQTVELLHLIECQCPEGGESASSWRASRDGSYLYGRQPVFGASQHVFNIDSRWHNFSEQISIASSSPPPFQLSLPTTADSSNALGQPTEMSTKSAQLTRSKQSFATFTNGLQSKTHANTFIMSCLPPKTRHQLAMLMDNLYFDVCCDLLILCFVILCFVNIDDGVIHLLYFIIFLFLSWLEMIAKLCVKGLYRYVHSYRNITDGLIFSIISFIVLIDLTAFHTFTFNNNTGIMSLMLVRLIVFPRNILMTKQFQSFRQKHHLAFYYTFSHDQHISFLCLLLFTTMFSCATLGELLFGGGIVKTGDTGERIMASDFGTNGYWPLNFNDCLSALVTMFVLLHVNNMHITASGFVASVGNHPVVELFFVGWYVVGVLYLLNVLIAVFVNQFAGYLKSMAKQHHFESQIKIRNRKQVAQSDTSTKEDGAITEEGSSSKSTKNEPPKDTDGAEEDKTYRELMQKQENFRALGKKFVIETPPVKRLAVNQAPKVPKDVEYASETNLFQDSIFASHSYRQSLLQSLKKEMSKSNINTTHPKGGNKRRKNSEDSDLTNNLLTQERPSNPYIRPHAASFSASMDSSMNPLLRRSLSFTSRDPDLQSRRPLPDRNQRIMQYSYPESVSILTEGNKTSPFHELHSPVISTPPKVQSQSYPGQRHLRTMFSIKNLAEEEYLEDNPIEGVEEEEDQHIINVELKVHNLANGHIQDASKHSLVHILQSIKKNSSKETNVLDNPTSLQRESSLSQKDRPSYPLPYQYSSRFLPSSNGIMNSIQQSSSSAKLEPPVVESNIENSRSSRIVSKTETELQHFLHELKTSYPHATHIQHVGGLMDWLEETPEEEESETEKNNLYQPPLFRYTQETNSQQGDSSEQRMPSYSDTTSQRYTFKMQQFEDSSYHKAAILLLLARDGEEHTIQNNRQSFLCYRYRSQYSILFRAASTIYTLLRFFERPLWTFTTERWNDNAIYPKSGWPIVSTQLMLGLKFPLLLILFTGLALEFGYKENFKGFLLDEGFLSSISRMSRVLLMIYTLVLVIILMYVLASGFREEFLVTVTSAGSVIYLLWFNRRSLQKCKAILHIIPKFSLLLLLLLLVVLIFGGFGPMIFNLDQNNGTTLDDDYSVANEQENYFDTFEDSVWSVFVSITSSSYPNQIMPSYRKYREIAIYFISFITLGSFGLLNIIVVIVLIEFQKQLQKTRDLHRISRDILLTQAFIILDNINRHSSPPVDADDELGSVITYEQVERLLSTLSYYSYKPPSFMNWNASNVSHQTSFRDWCIARIRSLLTLCGFVPIQSDQQANSEQASKIGETPKEEVLELPHKTKQQILIDILDIDGDGMISNYDFLFILEVLRMKITIHTTDHFLATHFPTLVNSRFFVLCQEMVEGRRFDVVVDILAIVLVSINAALNNADTYSVTTSSLVIRGTILVLYSGEMLVKLLVKGWRDYWHSFRNRVDGSITLVMLLCDVINLCLGQIYCTNTFTILSRITLMIRVIIFPRNIRLIFQNNRDVVRLSKVLRRIFSKIFTVSIVFTCTAYFFATVGVFAFGGMIAKDNSDDAFTQSPYVSNGYWGLNFNDFLSAFITLFCCLHVSDFDVIASGFTIQSNWPRWYFACWYVTGVLLMLNILKSFFLGEFLALFSSSKKSQDVPGMRKHVARHRQESKVSHPANLIHALQPQTTIPSDESEAPFPAVDDERKFDRDFMMNRKIRNRLLDRLNSLVQSTTPAAAIATDAAHYSTQASSTGMSPLWSSDTPTDDERHSYARPSQSAAEVDEEADAAVVRIGIEDSETDLEGSEEDMLRRFSSINEVEESSSAKAVHLLYQTTSGQLPKAPSSTALSAMALQTTHFLEFDPTSETLLSTTPMNTRHMPFEASHDYSPSVDSPSLATSFDVTRDTFVLPHHVHGPGCLPSVTNPSAGSVAGSAVGGDHHNNTLRIVANTSKVKDLDDEEKEILKQRLKQLTHTWQHAHVPSQPGPNHTDQHQHQ